jgi:hypothetical protein
MLEIRCACQTDNFIIKDYQLLFYANVYVWLTENSIPYLRTIRLSSYVTGYVCVCLEYYSLLDDY